MSDKYTYLIEEVFIAMQKNLVTSRNVHVLPAPHANLGDLNCGPR